MNFNLNGINEQARFFLALGYSKDRVISHLESTFPGADHESAWEAAAAQQRENERQLDAACAAEDARAVAAEHDINQTMHEEGQ